MGDADSYLRVDIADHVAIVTLNRPERLNSFTLDDANELVQTLDRLQNDESVRVAILTGAGRAFCSGVNVAMGPPADEAPILRTPRQRFVRPVAPFITQIDEFEKPLIAAVNGFAVGAGMSIAMACDIRIAARSASFIPMWVDRAGVPDAGGAYYLPRLVGLGMASELTFTGDEVDSKSALRIGLVNRVVPDQKLMAESKALASRIAAKAPITVALIKRTIRMSAEATLREALLFETLGVRMGQATEDRDEALAARREKRTPRFKGR